MLSFRNEYCFFFFLRHIFMCGHFNAVLPSETCRTKTWAEGLATMYNQKPTSLPVSEWLVFNLHAFKTQWQQAPTGVPQRRISSRTFGIVAAASSAPGCARQPALNSSGHLQAPWYCTLTLQQPARLQRLPPGRGCAGVKGAL